MSVRLDWLSEEMEKRYQPEDDKPKPLPCPAALMYDDDQMATKDSSDNQKRLRPNTDNDDSRSAQERVTLQVNQSPTPPRRPAWVLSGVEKDYDEVAESGNVAKKGKRDVFRVNQARIFFSPFNSTLKHRPKHHHNSDQGFMGAEGAVDYFIDSDGIIGLS
ncbi:hypothetical protein BY996DRAFT_6493921 [Phakopsora pachyrhizi]|nr:hypothetical protein BY996DRAFT_6493921 [Phakopsora pachyrhizi]